MEYTYIYVSPFCYGDEHKQRRRSSAYGTTLEFLFNYTWGDPKGQRRHTWPAFICLWCWLGFGGNDGKNGCTTSLGRWWPQNTNCGSFLVVQHVRHRPMYPALYVLFLRLNYSKMAGAVRDRLMVFFLSNLPRRASGETSLVIRLFKIVKSWPLPSSLIEISCWRVVTPRSFIVGAMYYPEIHDYYTVQHFRCHQM